jgi:hypothetical protein
MNYLKDKAVYLCGGMSAYKDSGMGWRDEVKPILTNRFGIHVYDPTHKEVVGAAEIGESKEKFRKLILEEKWVELKEAFDLVVRWDLRAVDKADFLIVDYDPTIHTVGTIHELVLASSQKKPILVKYQKAHLSKVNPWMSILIRPEHFFSEWDDLFAYLQQVDEGHVNSDYWSIV